MEPIGFSGFRCILVLCREDRISTKVEIRHYLSRQTRGKGLLYGPIHPLLLRGPDVLFSEEANLCGIFFPLAAERANPAHLAARLIESRLALPSECRMVLVVDRDESSDLTRDLRRDFNLIANLGEASLGSFLRDRLDRGASKTTDRKIKLIASARFGEALKVSQQSFRQARVLSRRGDGPSERWIPTIDNERSTIHSGPFTYRPQNRFDAQGTTFSLLTAAKRGGLTRQLRAAGDATVLASWQLDEGVPYPITAQTHLAVASHGMKLLGIRERLLTAAAFAGMAVTPSEDPELIVFTAEFAQAVRNDDIAAQYGNLV